MRGFLLRRLGYALVTLLLVSVLVFVAAQVLPGDVGRTILGPFATPEQVDRLNAELGTDRPLPVRYADWLGSFLGGDWGESFRYHEPVRPLVSQRLVNSSALASFAFLLAIPIAVLMGIVAARRAGRLTDRVITVTGMSLIALPEFVIGVVVLVVFAVNLRWFPTASMFPEANPVDVVRQFLLPSLPLVFVLFGYVSQMARAGTHEALESNYTRTAVLKGLPERTVLVRHVLRNGLLPTITVIGVQMGWLIGGLTVVEVLFSYPGIGRLVIESAVNHDLPVLQAAVLVMAAMYMFFNLSADLLYGVLNPRIRRAT